VGLDIKKISSKELNQKLDEQEVEEKLSLIPEGIIQFSGNPILNYCFDKKVGLQNKTSPRVLVNWTKHGIVEVSDKDKGKIKRFGKLESIWLNILVELREFGMSIESIQRTRKILFSYVVNDFSLFKFQILHSILKTPQMLLVFKDGDARIISTENYIKLLEKNRFLPHLSLNLEDFIKPEYPNHSFDKTFNLSHPFESIEKVKLLFFLRTGDFSHLKVKISDGDVRYIENVKMLLSNEDVIKALNIWNFKEILVSIDDDTETIIASN